MVTRTAAASPPPAAEAEAPGVLVYRWFILSLLALGAVFAFLDRANISTVITVPAFSEAFHLDEVAAGLLNSAFFWAYTLLQIPMGWAVDRYGVKIPYAIGILVWSGATVIAALTHTVPELIVARVLVGAGESVVVPASYRWIRNNFQEHQNGLAVGIYMLGTKVGPALGAPAAVWLISAHGWKAMFVIMGGVGLVWLIPWLLVLKADRPAMDATSVAKRKAEQLPFSNILKSPMVWGSIVINFCYNYFTFYCLTWMPAYFKDHLGFSLKKMALFSFFQFAGIAIVALIAGWTADRMIARGGDAVAVRKAFVVGGFVLACTELLGLLTPSADIAGFWAIVSLSGLGLATANHLALVRLTLIPKQAAGRVTGVQNVSTGMAGAFGPLLSGWLLKTTGSYLAPMLVIFVFLVIGAVTCIVLLRREWAPKLPDGVAAG